MADEIKVTTSLVIKLDNFQYRSFPNAFTADMATGKGPSPGYIDIPTTGRDIYFTELTQPAFCVFQNLEDDGGNYFDVGIYEPATRLFYPLLEVNPGEIYVVKLSRNLMEQTSQSGTGTTGPENYLRVRAGTHTSLPGSGGTVKGFVGAFET